MESVVSQIVGHIMNILTSLTTKHLRYVISSRKYVNDMTNAMKVLEGKSDDVKRLTKSNNKDNIEIPSRIEGWLEDVENVKNEVQNISSDFNGCFDMKKRYIAGRNAFMNVKDIERLINEETQFKWTGAEIPLGRVDYNPTSTSAPSPSGEVTQNDFKSRDEIFMKALKFLQQDVEASQVIALCGMGGVGKTTMMDKLEMVARNTNMFKWVVKVAIGKSLNILSIQVDIAVYLKVVLPEGSQKVKADHLCKSFKNILEKKEKILVMLDDVWEKIELKDIGLPNPLPNGVKLLLTSRNSNICTQIAAYAGLRVQVVNINVLEEGEARNLFSQIAGISKEKDHDKYLVGCDIVKKCGCLPLAIKLIASALTSEEEFAWRSKLDRLKHNDLDENVQEIIKISYEYVKEDEDKQIFLHCSLFPEDFDIPIEDLMRHALGLNILKNVSTLREARDRTNTCVQNLKNANLLINSDRVGFVKIHDLVLAFMLGRVFEEGIPWIINHGDISKRDKRDEIGESCKRISLTCSGLSEFPRDFKYPNLSHLQLMNGDPSLSFPDDFYKNMENLTVIAFYRMKTLQLPRSLQCSTNLKSLCLHECKLKFDFSFIGDLVNMEVLSLSHCGIRKLPTTLGNLRKLRLLDLTGCIDLHIDDGVLKNFEKLEELYMRVSCDIGQAIRFTDANIEELKMLSNQLSALEVEFVEKSHVENLSFEKLVKFKIAVGCDFQYEYQNKKHSFTNTLKLVTDRNSLVDCKINKLFNKTEKLQLQVKEATCLEDVLTKPYNQPSFCNLRDLEVYNCNELKFLFPMSVACDLRKLESLKISSCSILEAVIENDGSEISSVDEIIKFENLKYLSLSFLPKLGCLFNVENVVELSQLVYLEVVDLPNFSSIYPDKDDICALLNSKVKSTNLEKLNINKMKGLKQIWGCEIANNVSKLRDIEVYNCNSLTNMFPTNPMRLLNHLERLTIVECNSIEEIFNIDLDSLCDEVEKHCSSLRSIHVFHSNNLKEVWRIKGGGENKISSTPILIGGFEALESIRIERCQSLRNVFPPTNTNIKFDMTSLVDIICIDSGNWWNDRDTKFSNRSSSLIPSNAIGQMQKLQVLKVEFCNSLMEIFGTQESNNKSDKNSGSANIIEGTAVISRRENINVPHLSNLKKLVISKWKRLQYVFTFSTLESLKQIKELQIMDCEAIKVIVKEENGEHRKDVNFPRLKLLKLTNLPNLKGFFLGMNGFRWPLLENVEVYYCSNMMVFTSGQSTAPKLKYIHTNLGKHSLKYGLNHQTNSLPSSESRSLERLPFLSFHNLIELHMERNDDAFKCIIHSNELQQLQNLETMRVELCKYVEEVFEVEALTTQTVVQIPNLTQIQLSILPSLKYIWKSNHHHHVQLEFPNLTTLSIVYCESLKHVFTSFMVGSLQQLQDLDIGRCSDIEVIVKEESECDAKVKKILTLPSLKSMKLGHLSSLKYIWKSNHRVLEFPNLTTLYIDECRNLKHVFTSSMVGSLQQLQDLQISKCSNMEVIVEEESECDAKVTFPCLKSLRLNNLYRFKGFWLGKDDFLCPSLDTLEITQCPKIMCFTMGHLDTPALNIIDNDFRRFHITEDLNSFIKNKRQEGFFRSRYEDGGGDFFDEDGDED